MDDQAKANLLREGIAAAQSGDREQAYRLFSQLTEDDYNNANAWIWLSAVADDPDEALGAARNALALEPTNEFAQQAERLAQQAKEERSQSEQVTTQGAMEENAEEAIGLTPLTPPASEVSATTAPTSNEATSAEPSLLPPFLTQEMAAQGPESSAPPPMATRPARSSFTSRLEARTAVRTDASDIQAAQRRQTLYTAGIVLLALVILGGLIWWLVSNINNGQGGQLQAQAEPSATPVPSPTIPPVLRVTATAQALLDATATANAQLLNATATTQAQEQQNAQATFAAQTFPTATPGVAVLAYQQGLDDYNRKQYAQAAAALEQAVQLDRNMVLGHYYLGLSDLALAQPALGQPAASLTLTATAVTTTPISGTPTPISSTLTPALTPISSTGSIATPISGTLPPAPTPSSSGVATPTSADYYERAALAFRNVTSLAPNWAGGYAGLADTYLRQSRYQDALGPAQQAVNLDNGRPEYYLLLGRIYDGLGRSADAKAAYDAAAGLAPPIPGQTPFPTPTNAPVIPTPTQPAAPTPELLTATPGAAAVSSTPATTEPGLVPSAVPTSAPAETPSATPQSAQPAAPAQPTATLPGFVVTVVVPLARFGKVSVRLQPRFSLKIWLTADSKWVYNYQHRDVKADGIAWLRPRNTFTLSSAQKQTTKIKRGYYDAFQRTALFG